MPPITVLLSLGRGTPRHEYHSIAQPQQREIEASLLKSKNQNLKKGRKVAPGARLVYGPPLFCAIREERTEPALSGAGCICAGPWLPPPRHVVGFEMA